MQYRLIAIDLDGTLLGRDQIVSQPNIKAIAHAQSAGALVVPCTGRGWREAMPYLKDVSGLDVGVFNTGAIVVRTTSGETIGSSPIAPGLAVEIVGYLGTLPEAVLVYQDASRSGYDYLICGSGKLTDETRDWFDVNTLRTHRVSEPTLDDLNHTLRISIVAFGAYGFAIEDEVTRRFGERVNLHCFAGVPGGDASRARFMVEVFAQGVDKWHGIQRLASQLGIEDHEIATIGDEVNDLAMLRHAGLGIAMGNATDAARAEADRVTLSQQGHGVAYALDQMLSGDW